jgi:hypothetical protein
MTERPEAIPLVVRPVRFEGLCHGGVPASHLATARGGVWWKCAVLSLLALVVALVPLRREFVLGTTQEFANYGDLAIHILNGDGARTNLGQPFDLHYFKEVYGHAPAHPWPTAFRPLGPAYIGAALISALGHRDVAVIGASVLGYTLTIGLTVVLGECCFGPWIGVLAALPYLASRPILANVYNAYPDSLFSVAMLAVFLVYIGRPDERALPRAFLVGLCGGMAQLLRVNFVSWVPLFLLVFLLTERGARRWQTPVAFAVGLAIGGLPEWLYALINFGTVTRTTVGLQNLANVRYGQTWLHYVHLDLFDILRDLWRPLLTEWLANFPSLVFQSMSGVEGPTTALGILRRLPLLCLFVSGVFFIKIRQYPHRLQHAYLLLSGLVLWQAATFAVLRQGSRYFYWFIPLFWLFALLHGRWWIERVQSRQGDRARWLRFGSLKPSCAMLMAGVLAWNALGIVSGTRPVAADSYGPNALREIRDVQLPRLRQLIPSDAAIASDQSFVLWYLGNPTIPLPLDVESYRSIEGDYFPIDYIYLTGMFFGDMPGDPEDYVRAYFRRRDGSVAQGRTERLALFRSQFPDYQVDVEFPDGAVLLARRSRGRSNTDVVPRL